MHRQRPVGVAISGALAVLLGLASIGTGCGSTSTGSTSTTTDGAAVGTTTNNGQTLPIGATITVGSTTIGLEVARTPVEQEIGLMGRTSLAADRGMVFPFTPAQRISFWMKDTLIPLDLVFVRDGIVTKVVANAPPCTADSCPTWSSDGPVDSVIELRAGMSDSLGIRAGTRLDIVDR